MIETGMIEEIKKNRYTKQTKCRVVEQYLFHPAKEEELCEEFDISREELLSWKALLENEEKTEEKKRKRAGKYSEEFKKELIRLHVKEGRTFQSLMEEFSIDKHLLFLWKKKFYQDQLKITPRYTKEFRAYIAMLYEEKIFSLLQISTIFHIAPLSIQAWRKNFYGEETIQKGPQYEEELKQEVARLYIEEDRSLRELINQFSVSRKAILSWSRRFYPEKAKNKEEEKKHTPKELRMKIARLHVEEGRTLQSLAEEFGINRTSIYPWIKSYEKEIKEEKKKEPFVEQSQRRSKYSEELRVEIARLHVEEGRTLQSLAEEFGVSIPSISAWSVKYYGPKRAYQKDFQKEIARLRAEEGRTLQSLMDEFGVCESSIVTWEKKYYGKTKGMEVSEELKEEIARLYVGEETEEEIQDRKKRAEELKQEI